MSIPDEERRRLVWVALADLYLDTELKEHDFHRIATVCAESGFSWAEIQLINYNEVAPALWFNVQDIAGAWAGWNEEWLTTHIQQCYRPAPRKWFGSTRLWQKRVDFFTRKALARIAAYLR
ncbi:DUF7079 family protein [Hymenobacter pini]|uniref:DUF7079 family protein n=1 Tax=Hymenobacter pini TaxID=2880879 RepID=UPI001CF53A62|nr:hypothetical protein [Hymenobacter pini]MCA8831198.1 hypothetical protein [Hymenobacter pini]